MTKHLVRIGLAVLIGLAPGVALPSGAQEPNIGPGGEAPKVPLQLQVVISRTRGDKKISSLPYLLSIKPDETRYSTRLRVGAQIPIPNSNAASAATVTPPAYAFKEIGTSIDASAMSRPDGRFQIYVSISETSIYGEGLDPKLPVGAPPPVLRSYQSSNLLVLRDGQTSQFTAGADPLTGDVVRVDVTLTVVK